MPDLVILTDDEHVGTSWRTSYDLQLLLEDELVKGGAEAHGLTVERRSWSDPSFDWASTRAVIFRSTWDYFFRFPKFEPWLDRLSSTVASTAAGKSAGRPVQLFNAKETIYWNLHKKYMLDLEEKDVRIVPTILFKHGSALDLEDEMMRRGWSEAIVKPAVSGNARHTYRLKLGLEIPPTATGQNGENATDGNHTAIATAQKTVDELLAVEDMLLQPFVTDVVANGELSLIVIDGQYTHAVKKLAKQGDFRVQDDHGGRVVAHSPSEDEIELAERAIAACDPVPLYARVDIVRDSEGRCALMELELIEPELFLRFNTDAARMMGIALKRRLGADERRC